jgi:hypothetical protein
VGDDRPRSRPAVLRRPSAARPCRPPPLLRALHVRSRIWHHHGRERGPAALAGRAEARGSEKSELAQQARGLRDLRRRFILLADRRTAYAESNTTTNKHIPRRGRKAGRGAGGRRTVSTLWGLGVVPTDDAYGIHRRRHYCRHHRRPLFGGCRQPCWHHRRHTSRQQAGPEFSWREIG